MLVLIIFALLLTGCSDNKAAPVNRQGQAAPVYISKAVLKSVPIEIETVGNVEAYSTVLVKAQIGGELTIVDSQKAPMYTKATVCSASIPRPTNRRLLQPRRLSPRPKRQFRQ